MPSVLSLLLSAAAVMGPVHPPPWLWPLDGPHTVTRPYVQPVSQYGRGHRGVDLGAPVGAVVRAPADGIVHFVGFVVDRPVLSLRHEDGVLSSFEPVASTLRRGDVVEAGEEIGTLIAGHCEPDTPCLHVGVRVLGQYVSPLKYLGGIPRPVLLPTRRYD